MFERQRRTKILATLGPATDPPGILEELFRAGVNVVRLNFSHGDPSGQAKRAADVRAAAARVGVEVGILADLPGPKIRIERFAEGKVQLKAGWNEILVRTPSHLNGKQLRKWMFTVIPCEWDARTRSLVVVDGLRFSADGR